MSGREAPKVSIISCVYNGYDFLNDFEQYVERQSFDDFELIFVVDQRSNDGSIEEIERYCGTNPKARFLVQTGDGKLGGSKNMGLAEAKGDYLWFVDVDDVPSDNFLERMVSVKESKDCDVVICNFQFISKRDWNHATAGDVIDLTGKSALHARSLNLIPVTSWSMLYDRHHIMLNELEFREMMSEDIVFTYKVLNLSSRVCFITEPLYGYYINRNSFCNSRADERGESELDNYIFLSDLFSSSDRYLQARFCIIGLRSLSHMTRSGIKSKIKDTRLKVKVNTYLGFAGKLEYRGARCFPSLYRAVGSWYIKHRYNRIGKIYVDERKMETLRKIAKKRSL